MKKYILPALLLVAPLFLSANAEAKLKTMNVEYKDGDQVLQGYLAYDDASKVKRPGILVTHEWKGIDKYTKMRTEQLAKLGYVAFAPDIYGKGVRPTSTEEASKTSGQYKQNRSLLRSRIKSGYGVLKNYQYTDPNKIVAIGYCFGGTAVLELARSGEKLDGVVSIHGGLDTPNINDGKNIKTEVLVLHGADDPNVPAKDIDVFQNEMRLGNVDWRMISYGDAVHGFSNPNNGTDKSKGVAYNKKADMRSFKDMMSFFKEVFNK